MKSIIIILIVSIAGLIVFRFSASKESEHEHHQEGSEISEDAAKKSGIIVEKAAPARIKTRLPVHCRISFDEDHLAHVNPRFPGIVKEVKKRLGDSVSQGEVLAVVESNANLQRYEIRALLSGKIVKKDITVGEFASEKDTIYVIADLNTVWVDVDVYRQDFSKLKVGQELRVQRGGNNPPLNTQISYISPFGWENTQSGLARAILANPNGELMPGLFVSGDLLIEEVEVPLAVRAEALQIFNQKDAVFVQEENNHYEERYVKRGRYDEQWVEIIEGLSPGESYVSKNSFIIKADLLKSGAEHEH